jgi:hypothetical protein
MKVKVEEGCTSLNQAVRSRRIEVRKIDVTCDVTLSEILKRDDLDLPRRDDQF